MQKLNLFVAAATTALAIGMGTAGIAQDAGLILCLGQRADLEDRKLYFAGFDPRNLTPHIEAQFPDKSISVVSTIGPTIIDHLRGDMGPQIDGFLRWDDNIATDGDFQLGTYMNTFFESLPELSGELASCAIIHAQDVCPSPHGGPVYVPCE